MGSSIRVGVIGANPERGWAARAHIPALRAVPGLELSAVGTSRPESARRAAEVFGAAHAFSDPRALATHPDVDVVAITVKVPAHAELIRVAVEAGKHVYCEWPLALSTAQALELMVPVTRAGVHHAIGLQARFAPAIRQARRLIAEGAVGQVLSATVYAARGKGAAGRLPAWAGYTVDETQGAGLLEVAGGHTLDALRYLLGDIAELSAHLSIQRPRYVIEETGETVTATSPDHLLLQGILEHGGVVSAQIHDGKVTDGRTRIEIAGSAGDIAIVSGAGGAGGIQMSELRLFTGVQGTWQEVPMDADPADALDGQARNVARLYSQLAHDIRDGGRTVPDFGTALHTHRLLDTVRRSAGSGTWCKTRELA